jgi:OmpA-like transmembrane domain
MPERRERARRRSNRGLGPACLLLLGFAAAGARAADDLIGPYVGVTFGKATLDASTGLVTGFGEHSSAYQIIAGWRPISELAAELEYLDFGRSSGPSTYQNSSVPLSNSASRKGVGAFALLYLPTPIVDFYLKAGVAKLHTTADTIVGACPMGGVCPPLVNPPPVDQSSVGLAGGGGVMYRFRSLELRAEYQRFASLGGNPYMVTGGLSWTF